MGYATVVNSTSALPSLATDTWYHIAVVRNGPTAYMFFNGISIPVTQVQPFATYQDYDGDLGIARDEGYINGYFDGSIDEFRISKGIARWTTDFTPPTSEYTAIEEPDTYSSPEPSSMLLFGIGLLGARLFYYTNIAVYIFMDGLLSGMAIWMVRQTNEGKKPNIAESIKRVLPKYVILVAFLFTIFLIMRLVFVAENLAILKLLKLNFVAVFAERGVLNFIKLFFNFSIIVLIEVGFAFVIPFAVLEAEGFLKSIGRSFALAKKLFPATFLLIAVPTLFSIPISLSRIKLPVLMNMTLPEIAPLVLALSVVVAVFIDCMVTTSLAFLFLLKKA